MAINDYIISTLNLRADSIESLSVKKTNNILHISVKLVSTHPSCPGCEGKIKKGAVTVETAPILIFLILLSLESCRAFIIVLQTFF